MNAEKAPTFASINSNLLSFPELFNDDCVCTLRKDNFECVKEGETVVEGPQNHPDGMWDYNILVPLNDPLPPITEEEVNSAYNQRTKAELIIYQHAVLSASPVAALIKAINNKWLTSFPGMTVDNERRHLPKSIQISMGHLARVRKKCPIDKRNRTNR